MTLHDRPTPVSWWIFTRQPELCFRVSVQHPAPAALIAYARFSVDFEGQVARHIAECEFCADLVQDEQRSPSSADEKRVLKSLGSHPEALIAAAGEWAKAVKRR